MEQIITADMEIRPTEFWCLWFWMGSFEKCGVRWRIWKSALPNFGVCGLGGGVLRGAGSGGGYGNPPYRILVFDVLEGEF